MYFLFIKVINIDCKEDIFLALQSVGINKASYFLSHNLDQTLSDDLPIFAGFFRSDEDKAKEQYIITCLVKDKKSVQSLLDNLKQAGLDIENEPLIRLILLPVTMLFDQEMGLLNFD